VQPIREKSQKDEMQERSLDRETARKGDLGKELLISGSFWLVVHMAHIWPTGAIARITALRIVLGLLIEETSLESLEDKPQIDALKWLWSKREKITRNV
jgi:hypothetical protein